jgi:putative transposase
VFRQRDQTYFVTFQTARRLPLFRNERWAVLFIEVWQRYLHEFELHDFVVMHDHIHLLLSPKCPLEKAVQLIKGGYSFAAKRAFKWKGEIWQAGFSDHRIRDFGDWELHIAYIAENVDSLKDEGYRFCGSGGLVPLSAVPPWLKPQV